VLALAVVLTVHVAAGADGPIADDAWLDHEVATATERLGGAEISRTAGGADGVPDAIATVDDRDALAAMADDDGTVHVFVVERVADKDKDGVIGGVTWVHGRRRYIIVSHTDGREDTLAHELGHFFGLSHTSDPHDLMTPAREPGGTLTDAQLTIVRRHLAAFTRR
jgi:hypothetical protein